MGSFANVLVGWRTIISNGIALIGVLLGWSATDQSMITENMSAAIAALGAVAGIVFKLLANKREEELKAKLEVKTEAKIEPEVQQ